MEDEGEEIVVTAPRLRDEGGGGGGGWGGWGGWGGGSTGGGADAFDFGGGGGGGGAFGEEIVVTAPPPEDAPAEEEAEQEIVVTAPSPADQALVDRLLADLEAGRNPIVVTAPRTEASGTAIDVFIALDQFARGNIEGDYRLTRDGDTVTLDAFDTEIETRFTVTYDESDNRAVFGYQDFDVDAYQRPEGYQPNSLPDDNPFW